MENETIVILEEYVEEGIEVKLESQLITDLGLSSLDVVNIVVAFEDKFDIEIPDRVIPQFVTVNDIVDYLKKHV